MEQQQQQQAACGFFFILMCTGASCVPGSGHKATAAVASLFMANVRYLQPTYIRGERLNILGLALARPALLTRRLRQSGDDMRCGHKDARRNNTTTGIRVWTGRVIVR